MEIVSFFLFNSKVETILIRHIIGLVTQLYINFLILKQNI